MADQTSIVNRALLQIGARAQVSGISPSDGSTEANAASVLFAPTFESLGRTAHWNCLRAQATLSLLAAAQGTPENPLGTSLPLPPSPWLYSYAYPSDCLAMRYIVPSLPSAVGGAPATSYNNAAGTWLPGQSQISYSVVYATDVENNPIIVILTNQSQAQAVYTVNQPNPAIWDSQFQAAMVASLAAFMVAALTGNMAMMQAQVAAAERIIMQARASDGNEGVTVMDHLPDWMRARGGEWGWAPGNNVAFGGYGAMAWP